MTDQHYHRATDEQWAEQQSYGFSDGDSSCILELRHRVQALEAYIATTGPLAARIQAAAGSVMYLGTETSKLGHRIELLEATQRAHIEAKAAEAGARCAVEQLRSKPGEWQPIRTFTADEVAPIVVPAAEPAAEHPATQFTAKYFLTACDILDDSFRYSQSDMNSVWFDITSDSPVPGDNIKIAHHWGGMPTNGVYSTINYKVTSVSELENGVRRVRATRVDAQQLTLVKRVGCLVAKFASEGLPGDDAVPTAREILRLIAEYLRSDHPNHFGPGTDWADHLDAEANQ